MVEWRERGYVQDSDDDEEEDLSEDVTNLQDYQDGHGGAGTQSNEKETEKKTTTRQPVPVVVVHSAQRRTDDGVEARSSRGTPKTVHVIKHTYSKKSLRTKSFAPSSSVNQSSDDNDGAHVEARSVSPRLYGSAEKRSRLPNLDIYSIPLSPETSVLDPNSHTSTMRSTINAFPTSPKSSDPRSLDSPRRTTSLPPSTPPTSPLPGIHSHDIATGQFIANEQTSSQTVRKSRNFRPRNPIQLHPYAVENERYRQTLKARGIRPVILAHETNDEPTHGAENETQSQDRQYNDSQDLFADNASSHSDMSPIREDHDLVHREDADRYTSVHDRKNVLETVAAMRTPVQRAPNTIQTDQSSNNARLGQFTQCHGKPTDTPNPKTSRRVRLKKFKKPLVLVSTLPPSPPVALEPLDISLSAIETSDSECESRPYPYQAPMSALNEPIMSSASVSAPTRSMSQEPTRIVDSDNDDSSEREVERFKKAKKRLRGVLPASWLRLDRQPKPAQIPRNASPTSSRVSAEPAIKGVATRRTFSTARPQPSHQSPVPVIDISENSDEPQSTRKPRRFIIPPELDLADDREDFDRDVQDIGEDDWIDPMLPAVPRKRHNKPGGKTQMTLKSSFKRVKHIPPEVRQSEQKILSWKPTQDKNSQRTAQSALMKPAKRRMLLKQSVVDFSTSVAREYQPDFVRVAIRHARSRENCGRHRPSSKIFSMHTRQDNADIDSTLLDWNEGCLKREIVSERHIVQPSSNRQPLIELNYNTQQTRTLLVPSETSSKERVRTLQSSKHSSRNRVSKPKFRQQKLDVIRISPSFTTDLDKNHLGKENRARNERKITHPASKSMLHVRHGQLENAIFGARPLENGIAFKDQLRALDDGFESRRSHKQRTANPMLERFLENSHDNSMFEGSRRVEIHHISLNNIQNSISQSLRLHRRKRPPQQINSEALNIDLQPTELSDMRVIAQVEPTTLQGESMLEGLGPYGTFYTTDFDIKPCPIGTYFHRSTFVGSGKLQNVLKGFARDLDSPTAPAWSDMPHSRSLWGPWSQDISSQLQKILAQAKLLAETLFSSTEPDIADTCLQETCFKTWSALRDIIDYISSSLHFTDAIDRNDFVRQVLQGLHQIHQFTDVTSNYGHFSTIGIEDGLKSLRVRFLTYMLTLKAQIYHLACHGIVQASTKADTDQLLRSILHCLVMTLTKTHLHQAWKLFNLMRQRTEDVTVIDDQYAEVEAIVTLHNILPTLDIVDVDLWSSLASGFAQHAISTSPKVTDFESFWHDIFVVFPCLRFDAAGLLARKSGGTLPNTIWPIIKSALARVLDLCVNHSGASGPTLNAYIRATLSRCFHIIASWGFLKCEAMLGCLFDFFARHSLRLLPNEDGRNPSLFLSTLRPGHAISLEPSDRSFDIFLKTLYIGLSNLSDVYNPRKLGNVAWRFVPASAELLAKENDLRQEALEARRNHHDTLCVLYCASPAGHRPNIDNIRNLVDFRTSHSEVCRTNIRSWANLVNFQMVTQEPAESIVPFADWFNCILRELINLHQNARTEALKQADDSRSHGQMVPANLIEATIAANQKNVEALLKTALGLLKDSIEQAPLSSASDQLFGNVHFTDVFKLFHSKDQRPNSVIGVALEVHLLYFQRRMKATSNTGGARDNEDSQDFGDWSGLDEISSSHIEKTPKVNIDESIISPLQQLLSDSFGAESFFDESFLKLLTHTWAHACKICTITGKHDWTYYLDPHSSSSWQQLRDTDQTHKFLPYFVAHLIELDPQMIVDHRETILSLWMASLADRESQLKFQHIFTTALLNSHMEDPVLHNLPFAVNGESTRHDISLSTLRSRRLATIDAILANMRRTFEDGIINSVPELPHLRHTYSSILKNFMNAMKRNYRDVQQAASRGAYIDFVQDVIARLHQYTSDICPVDSFFTDSAAFPLPTSDPEYIVGRLKGYSLGTGNGKSQKKLSIFIQSLFERALLNGDQQYLVLQIANAVDDQYEIETASSPTLREILLRGVFSAYMDSMTSSSHGWIVAKPIAEAMSLIFDRLLYRFSPSDPSAIEAVTGMLTDFFQSLCAAVDDLVAAKLDGLDQHHVFSTLSAFYRAATNAACVVDYIYRFSRKGEIAVACTHHLAAMGTWLLGHPTDDTSTAFPPSITHLPSPPHPQFAELRAFTYRELSTTLGNNWVRHEGRYYIVRGSSRREVILGVGTVDEERSKTRAEIERFLVVIQRMPTFAGNVPAWQQRWAGKNEELQQGQRGTWQWEEALVMI